MKPIYLLLSDSDHSMALTASRFFGSPALPKGFPYPFYKDQDDEDMPYCFVGQINLTDLARFAPENPLPHKGLLSFFAKIDTYMGDDVPVTPVSGYISDANAVKVFYFPDCSNMEEIKVLDCDGELYYPAAFPVEFSNEPSADGDDHALFAYPTHRQWEAWDHPYEDWIILLQMDSFEGEDFDLNFMDCGVLDFLISPEALSNASFDNVRGIVLSS